MKDVAIWIGGLGLVGYGLKMRGLGVMLEGERLFDLTGDHSLGFQAFGLRI